MHHPTPSYSTLLSPLHPSPSLYPQTAPAALSPSPRFKARCRVPVWVFVSVVGIMNARESWQSGSNRCQVSRSLFGLHPNSQHCSKTCTEERRSRTICQNNKKTRERKGESGYAATLDVKAKTVRMGFIFSSKHSREAEMSVCVFNSNSSFSPHLHMVYTLPHVVPFSSWCACMIRCRHLWGVLKWWTHKEKLHFR